MKTLLVEVTPVMWDALAGVVDAEMLKLEITERHLKAETPDAVRDDISARYCALQDFRRELGGRP